MALADIDIKIEMPRRRAKLFVTKHTAESFKLPEGVHDCYVLGIFQYMEKDFATPLFACELCNGRVVKSSVDFVVFVDTDEDEDYDNFNDYHGAAFDDEEGEIRE